MGLDMYLFGIEQDKKEDCTESSSGQWKQVCYWRKANAIHKWFDYVQNQSPDWDRDYADLIAMSILPPDNIGCFFGSGNVDDWYWDNINDTIEQLTDVLENNFYHKFFYMASW